MNKPSTQRLIHIADLQIFKRLNLLGMFFALLISSVFLNAQSPSLAKTAKPVSSMGKVSQQVSPDLEPTLKKYEKEIYFTENKGQWPLNVLYKADFLYGQAVATPNGMVMSSFDPASVGARSKWMMDEEEAKHEGRAFNTPMPALKGHAWMMEFVGASPGMTTSNRDAKGDLANYFIGNDPSKHATDVKSYNEVWYNNVYNNIDVRYYPSAEGALEYDIIAKPGSDPSKIAIKFDGIEKLALNASGHLVLYTSVGEMDLPEPYVYQTVNGKEVKVEAAYALNANNELTFVFGKYNNSLPLVIDPIAMRWATWMTQNSANDNHGHCIWVQGSDIYVVSRFSGSGLITIPGSFSTSAIGALDLNVGKYTEPASVGGAGVRVWQTYLGGQEGDENPYVAEFGLDGLYIAGYTTSNNFPVAASGTAYSGSGLSGALSEGGDNCFVIKINAAGNSIKGAVIGGGGTDDIYDMRITAAGDVILGGLTTSTDLSSNYSGSGASNTNNGGNDFWLFKINQNLNTLAWMKNWGGSSNDQINIVNIHTASGDLYAGGSTSSTLTHVGTARQNTKIGGTVGYLMKANSAGTLQWSSYFNSSSNSNNTTILCMELNTAQNAFYFGGMTQGLASANLSSSGAYDNSQNGNRDFYVAKMALDQTFAYGTYVGSTADEDNMMGLNVDANDDVYIFGYTYATGTLFPTTGNPLQNTMAGGSRDKVFFKLETDLSALLYSTYYGGSSDDSDPVGQRGIKFSNCRIYTIVTSQSNNIPLTQGALNTTKTSSTSIYEPALIVWANPPDLGNNTISSNQFVCNGAQATGLTGPVPNYELPTIVRNTTTSTYPALTTAISYQWQSSPDQTTWTNIAGATGQNLSGAQMGNHTQTTYYRRIFNGDACVLNNGNSFVTIAVFRLTGTQVNNTCFGGTAGTITTSVSGNSGTPTYSWSDGGPATANRTGLAAGTYTVTASAPNGCVVTATFIITQPAQIAFTATPTNATCGASNGSILVSGVSGGSGSGFTYSRDGVTYQGGATFSGLAGGTYTLYVKDGSGCVRSQQVTVTSVNALTASVQTQSGPTCFGGANGSVTITQSGGTAAYQYQLGSGSFQSSATFTGLAAGTYTVTVRDANNCTATTTFTIAQPNSPALSVPTTTICEGSSVTLSANANGQNVSSYLWSTGATTSTISVNSPGVYWVTLYSADGCASNTDTIIMNVKPSPNIELDSLINVACAGDSTGAIDVNITTTIATCLAQPQTSPEGCTNCTSTASGNSNVTVAAGQKVCITGSFTGQLTINAGGKAVICANVSPQSVNVNGGELWITNSGVLNANNFSGAAGSIIRNYGSIITNNFLTNGRFYNFGTVSCVGGFQIASSTGVFVNDGNFTCTGNFINNGVGMSNNSMQVGSQFTNAPGATFFNSCNLRIDSQFNCNSQFYNYGNILMDQSNTNASVPVGVTLVMGQGSSMKCAQFNVNGTISGPAAACAQIVVTNQSRLFNGSAVTGYVQWADLDGNIETNNGTYGANVSFSNTPTCGTIPDVYTYSWSGPNGFAFNGQDISNLPAGTYTITVTNSFGCSSSATFTITGPQSPVVVAISSTTNASCGGSNGSLTAVGSGGTPNYVYSIDGVTFQASGVFSGLSGGSYTVTVKDSLGCTSIVRATINSNAPPTASIGSQIDVACFNGNTGSVTINAAGGTPSYQYQLGNGPFQAGATFNGLSAGSYVVTVKDANGCTATVSVTISQPASPLSASINSQTNVNCFGDATGSVSINATGGTLGNGYQYALGNGAFGLSNTFTGLAFGSYVVTVQDANGCITLVNVTITQPQAPLSVSITGSTNVCPTFATGTATALAAGGTPNYTYTWNTVPAQSGPTASGLAAGTYTVNVVDDKGCRTSTTVTISNNPKPDADGDRSICEKGAELVSPAQGESWSAYVGNPAPAVITPGGVVTGMNVGGVYLFILTNQFGCSDTVAITTTANCPLIANPDNATTNEDVTININVPSNDVDPDGNIDNGSVVIVTPPSNGTVVVNPNGTIDYTPNANYNGPDSFIYNICDTGLPVYCDTALVTINVLPINDAPIANLDVTSTLEDTPVTVFVPGNDTDVDGNLDNGSVTIVDQPNNGTVVVLPNGNVIYTPNNNFNGVDSLIYQICDTGLPVLCDTAYVVINVNTINDAPIANLDTTSTLEDTPVTVFVPGNDTDVDGNLDNGSVTIVDQPNNGSVVVLPNGNVIYTPNPNFNGVDSLIYQICDTGLPILCDTAYVVINVTPVNDAPIANQDNTSTGEDTPVTVFVPGNDTDVDGNLDNGSVTIIDQPNNGTVVVLPNGDVVYTPNTNFNGVDSLIYQICDTGLPVLCDTAYVVINVNPVNDPPVANVDTVSTPEDSTVVIDVPVNDTDPDGNLDSTSVVVIDPPNHGTVVVDTTNGDITYTPDPNYNGPDTLIYQICDTGMPVLCDTALVIINVIPVNDPPVAVVDTAITNEDVPVNINVDINDYDVDGNLDTNSVVIIVPPTNGNATYVDSTGVIIYIPAPNFCGLDSLQYSIADSAGAMDSAWVYIVVQCVPDLTVDPNVFPSGTNISCFGANDGSIDLTIDSGTPPYTITWTGPNNFSSNNEDIIGLAPGDYTVIVVDGNGNGDTATVTLTEPALLQHTLSAQIFTGGANISCAGTCDGAISLGITGGNAPYSILWTGPNGFTSILEDISALCGGTYYVSVVDLNGCAFTDSITLDQPDTLKALAVAATFVGGANVSCANACDGSIDLTISGGASPYTVAWTGPNNFSSASEDLSALCAGTYNVTVTDANGCTASYSITLTPPTTVDATLLPAAFVGGFNVSCANACDGAIDLSVSGGAAPYTYAWSGPSNFTSDNEDIEALCAGTYTVTITDANGCTATESITLTAPTPVAAAAVAATYVGGANVSCANACDGSINLTPSGGVAPYSYAWSGPNNFVAITQDLSGLCVGTYNVTVTDANGCTATTSVTLTAPQPVSLATISPVFNGGYNISCAGVCDGSISLTVSGGVGPFSYSWSGPSNFVAVTEDLSNLCAGTYTVIVTDANGCTATTSVTLTQPPVLNASIVAGTYAGGVNVSCANACDGFANLTVSGGTAPYTYSWTGPNFASQIEDLTGLCAGTYNVTVTDANGCTAIATVTLVAPVPVAAPAVAATYNGGVNVSCANACDGSINLSPSGGVAPYSFAWSGPNNFVSILEDISGLCPGTYTVIVTDANGCTATTSVTIVAPQPVSATALLATYNGGFNVSCSGACDGSANVTVTGGVAPYTYAWSGGNNFVSTLEDVNGLCSGAYTVIVTDANGCSDTLVLDLSGPQPVSATSVVTNSTCGQPNGSVTLTPAGGDGNYDFAWVDGSNTPIGGNSPSLSGLAAGTYTAIITDGNNCSATVAITIAETPAASATFVPTNALCNNVCNGSISLALTTGVLPFTYNWSGPNSYSSSNESISNLCPGVYNVNIEDANGCTAAYTYTITEPAAIAISIASNNAATCTANNGSASVVVIGGTGSYSYQWTGGSDSSSTHNMAAGPVSVIVTDANGCMAAEDVVIASQSNLALSTVITNANCNGGYCAIDLTVTGAVNPVYAWSVPATTEDVDSLAPGTYVVFVTDDNGCTGIDTVTVTEAAPIVIASADILVYPNGYNVSGIVAEDGVIELTVTGGSGSYVYEWSNGSNLEDQFSLAADTFNVTITDTNGCVLTEQYILEAPPLVELPTGFSPDGDGKNDTYIIHGIEKLNDNEFTVFNRWGQIIYNTKNYQNDWAGTNYQGNQMPDGTYFILFTVNIPNEGEKTFKATVEQRAHFVN